MQRTSIRAIPLYSSKRASKASRKAARQAGFSASRALPMVPRFYGRSTGEVKCVDVRPADSVAVLLNNVTYAEPGANTGYTWLNLVAQGAAVYNRVGTRVNFKSIQVRFMVSGQTAATVNAILRCIIVYDRQTNGAAPAIGTIFSDVTTAGAATTTFHSGLSIVNRSRFSIIRDEMIPMSFGGDSVKNYKTYAQGNWATEYSANGGTITDIASGGIYIIYAATVAGAAAGLSVSQISCRLRYYD